MSENRLVELQKTGQSIWYDNVRRALIDNGDLAQKISEDDLRGVTSNPAIFEKAIVGSTDYDTAMRQLIDAGKTVDEIYEALVIEDIQRVADLLRPGLFLMMAASRSPGATVFCSDNCRNSSGIFTAARALRMLSK